MPIDPVKVRAEIDSDPAGRGYADNAGSDNVIADLMNERIFNGRKPVRADAIEFVAWFRNLKPRIAQHAGIIPHLPPAAGTEPPVILACYQVVDIFSHPGQMLDEDLPQFTGAMDILQAAGLLDTLDATGAVLIPGADNRAAIMALADTLVSRAEIIAEQIGVYAEVDDISAAMNLEQ